MDKEILEDALLSALSLLNTEFESLEDPDLTKQYLIVMEKIENGLRLLQ